MFHSLLNFFSLSPCPQVIIARKTGGLYWTCYAVYMRSERGSEHGRDQEFDRKAQSVEIARNPELELERGHSSGGRTDGQVETVLHSDERIREAIITHYIIFA
ncbi:hypothetical protein EDB86DRAFT_2829357 [Lactarius hatsudake]|nr:hypothetical protein EDB86DRAFT_2829357 [Lactarius hatsudake]